VAPEVGAWGGLAGDGDVGSAESNRWFWGSGKGVLDARAEEPPFADEDCGCDFGVGVDFAEALGEVVEAVFGQGVEFLWAVEGDYCGAAEVFDFDPVV
jgi:hypothetical protein